MGGSDGKISEKERDEVWKDYLERIMNEENYCHHNVEGDTVDGPVIPSPSTWAISPTTGRFELLGGRCTSL